jgi:hypothetical protein
MRAKLYEDGIKRINTKIVVPMDITDVSDYILSAVQSGTVRPYEVTKLNKRQLLQVAKDEVESDGVHRPKESLSDIDALLESRVRTYVSDMFPELM